VALHEAVYAVMESLIPEYSAYGLVRTRSGNEMPGVAPSNTYPCRDGEGVVIGGNADGIFVRLMQAIGRSDLATDPRFRANQGRAAHSRLLDEAIASWTGVRSLDEVMAVMVEAGVPAGPVYTAREIVEDPHFRARDMFVERAVRVDGAAETVLFPGIVPKLELRPGEMQWPGPELGEHTDDVLGELAGIGEDELVELRRQGVI
jgi:formyl-CoA transferase